MNKKNNGVIIILMGLIIAILMVLCILFATKKIIINPELEDKVKSNANVTDNSGEKKLNQKDTSSKEYLDEKYKPVLEEIKKALNDEENQDNNYKYTSIILEYYKNNGIKSLNYTYYDLNKDGIKELIVENTYIYTLQDEKPVILISSPTIDGRYSFTLYENGIIFERRGMDSTTGYFVFSKISNTTQQLASSYYTYDYNINDEKIYNSNSNFENISLTEYKSDEELINKYVNNSKEISLKFDNQI